MQDDARQFNADLSTMIADLRAHAERRIAIYDSMGRFLQWVAEKDAEFEHMVGHFMPPPPPPIPTHAEPPYPQSYTDTIGRDPEHMKRLDEALGRRYGDDR